VVLELAAAGIVFRRCSRGFWDFRRFIELRGGGGSFRGAHHPLGRAVHPWRAPLGGGFLGTLLRFFLGPYAFSWPRKNPQKLVLRLDSVWYGFSVKQKQGRKQQLALGTMSIG